MIFGDGEALPVSNGTRTEDDFNTAFAPAQEYSAPCTGLIVRVR